MSALTTEDLVGTWTLLDLVVEGPGGELRRPLGASPRGMLVYGGDGTVSAMLAAASRGSLGPGGLEEAYRADEAAKAAAFDSFMAYAGRWRLQGDAVFHDVSLSLAPEAEGQTLVRRVERTATGMALRYVRMGRSGRPWTYRLTWTRASEMTGE